MTMQASSSTEDNDKRQAIERLLIQNLRNISLVDLQGLAPVNIFFGQNGSGKTSVLEAIAFLATGKSFRSKQSQYMIQHGEAQSVVHAQIQKLEQTISLGVSRNQKGERKVLAQGEPVKTLIELAQYLPFQLIDSKTFQVLHEGPSVRRGLMDWGVFHVEHQFRDAWLRLLKAVKQRNALLKQKGGFDEAQLSVWSQELVRLGDQLHAWRKDYLDKLGPLLLKRINGLIPEFANKNVELRYYQGWSSGEPYAGVLERSLKRDSLLGYTQYGPHRAHINILLDGVAATECVSRGQMKMLLIAFKLAQGDLLLAQNELPCVYLLDDLPSELDDDHLSLLVSALEKTGSQLFITSIEKNSVLKHLNTEKYKLFHVEHGKIKAAET